MAIIETFQIDEKSKDGKDRYFYQAFRILFGLILIHYWSSPEGIVNAISFPFKLFSLFFIREKKSGVKNEASRLRLAVRLWRFEIGTDLGWHDDPWGIIL